MFFTIPVEIIILTNAALFIVSLIIAIALINLGTSYTRATGDDETQGKQKKIILTLIMILLFISLSAAIFNALVEPV